MTESCHRCGGDLAADSRAQPYCPHCGAIELHLSSDLPGLSAAAASTTGELPPPRPRVVDWKSALVCALAVAVAGALLSLLSARFPSSSAFTMLFVIFGSIIAVGLYARHRPSARMNAAIGARIGITTGLLTTLALLVSLAAYGLVARFGRHSLDGFDRSLAAWTHQQIDHALATEPYPPEVVRAMYRPEFQTGLVLAEIAIFSSIFIGLSTLGGALGGLLRSRGMRRA